MAVQEKALKILILMSSFILCGCSLYDNNCEFKETIDNFKKEEIKTDFFLLTSYEKVGVKGKKSNVYIEGDGQAWLGKWRPALDPTPKNPLALKLATLDTAENVTYLARPCQYTKMTDGSNCQQKYWTSHRFAPEVIDAMDRALDDIKRRHGITEFHLIGFSGGGNVAALLSARRNDILSLRTVAGNLDHELQSQIHNVSAMPQSLNAKDIANQISHIPQIHFLGAEDQIVPQAIFESYRAEMEPSVCVESHIVQSASHIDGWASAWKSLSTKPLPSAC